MRSHFSAQMSKFFRIWTFVLLFLATDTLNKPAWGLISSVDRCLSQPACARAIGEELVPIVAAPLPEAAGTVAISATTATGVTTVSEAVAGVAVVADVRLSGVLAYHVWQPIQNKKAQEKAKQRYCEAYPTDVVCPRQLTGVPYRIIGDIYYESPSIVGIGNYWHTVFKPYVYHIDSIQWSSPYQPYGPVHGVYLQVTPHPTNPTKWGISPVPVAT